MNTEYALTTYWVNQITGKVKQHTEARFKINDLEFATDTFEQCAIHSSFRSDPTWRASKYTLKEVAIGTNKGEIVKEYSISEAGKCILDKEEVKPVKAPISKPKPKFEQVNPFDLATQIVGADIINTRGLFYVASAKALKLGAEWKIEARCQVVTHKLCADNLVHGIQAMGQNVFILSLAEVKRLIKSNQSHTSKHHSTQVFVLNPSEVPF